MEKIKELESKISKSENPAIKKAWSEKMKSIANGKTVKK